MGEERRIHDAARLAMLSDTGLLDRPPVPGLDRLTSLAARMLRVPTAVVSLVTNDRQVFASQLGMSEPWRSIGETPLSHSFCQFVVDDDAPLIVPDARADLRVRDNGAVRDLGVLAYAGMPIRVAGQTLGSFCAIDGKPREWSAPELEILEDLAGAVASEIALIRAADDAQQKADIIRAILVVSHDAYISIDADGRVLEWNPAAEALFGWSREEVTGCDLADLIIPPELRLAHRHGLDRVRDTSRSALAGHRLELIGLNRAGRTFPIEFSLQATEVHGQLRFHAFLHDISERRDTEAQLRRQAELIDAAPAAIIVRDTDGTVRSWNFGAEQMYGWPAHAVLGRDIHAVLQTEFPAGRQQLEKSLEATGTWQGELVHRRADGRPIVVLSQHALRPSARGGGHEVIETDADITDHRHAEEALAASERQFRIQFAQSTIGQAILRLDGRMGTVNEAYGRMLGYAPEELDGRRIDELTPAEYHAEDAQLRAGLFAGDYQSYERTKELIHADGHLVDVRTGVRPVRDADGVPMHLIGVVADITEQMRAERERDSAAAALTERNTQLGHINRELEQANLLKLDLMGMLSHDIGTPLASILGYSEMLAARDETVAPQLQKIMRAAQQIMVNFLTNAAKYGGGATAICVWAGRGQVAISVRDEGDGVPPDVRDYLFERFTRAAHATASGHGLGLHIVASLAEANGGLVAHHDNVPHGSVFTLTLPAAE